MEKKIKNLPENPPEIINKPNEKNIYGQLDIKLKFDV